MSHAPDQHRHSLTLNRVEAFSDGVFAIAITLLVLELRVPELEHVSGRELGDALLESWPAYAAFTLSFLTILVMWVNHHGIFTLVHHADGPFLFANGFLLLVVTAVPFPTAVVSRYLDTDAREVAVASYAASFVLISLGYNALWWSAAWRRRLLVDNMDEHQLAGLSRNFVIGPIAYGVALLLSFWNAYVGLAVLGGLWVLWAVMALDPGDQRYSRRPGDRA